MKKITKFAIGSASALVLMGACTAAVSGGDTSDPVATVETASPAPASPQKKVETPKVTKEQANALRAAENYVSLMGISKAGLIRQLSSPAADNYPKAAAKWAADHVKADWNKEAIEAAENYQSISPMSRSGLIRQLSSSAGDQFTKAQATQAADAVL